MPVLSVPVDVFDPAIPFELVSAALPGVDTWYGLTLITSELRRRLPHLRDLGYETLVVSGGVQLRVPFLEIGIKVGTLKVEKVKVLIVDGGFHDILLGSDLINQAFSIGADGADVSVSSASKEDPTALSVELYPLRMPFDLRLLERFLRYQRRLYNILLIADQNLSFSNEWLLENAIENDANIPADFVLQLSAVDSGSIWTSLKSGAQGTLRRLASVFDTSASAKLAQQMADAKKAETEAAISADTRDATATRLLAEQEMLRAENISKTYETWRNEINARVKFMDQLIGQIQDEAIRAELLRKKDEAIRELAEQQLLPLVRNIPHSPGPPNGTLFLPSRNG